MIIANVPIPIPVSTPPYPYAVRCGNAHNIPSKIREPLPVLPIYRVRYNIDREAGPNIMFGIWVLDVAFSHPEQLILFRFVTVPTDNGAVKCLNHIVQHYLYALIAF